MNSHAEIQSAEKTRSRLLVMTDRLVEALVVTLLMSIFVSRFVRTPNWIVRFAIVAPIVVAFLRKSSQPMPLKEP